MRGESDRPRGFSHLLLAVVAMLLPVHAVATPPQVGDAHELSLERKTETKDSEGSSGNSFDRWTIVERVIAVREDGVELEYDHSGDTPEGERKSEWRFPARVLRPAAGPLQLLNADELEVRLEEWLEAAKWTREICGRTIFTWNAFTIDCDPQSIIEVIESYEIGSGNLEDGVPYRDSLAAMSAPLTRTKNAHGGATFTAEMPIDAEQIRDGRARSDVGVAQIFGNELTLEDARKAHADDAITGTVTVRFETDGSGEVMWRTREINRQIRDPSGKTETVSTTEKTMREVISR